MFRKRISTKLEIIPLILLLLAYFMIKIDHKSNIILGDSNNEYITILNETKLMISSYFINSIQKYSKNAPINPKTRNPFLILFITSSGPHIWYALNAYCSIKAFLPSNYFIFVALSLESYLELKKYGVPAILFSYKAPPVVKNTIVKIFIIYQLLLSGIDVFFSDVDLVFFDNPLKVLNNNSDIEIIYEYAFFKHEYKNIGSHCVNTGLFKLNSNQKNIKFVKKWIQLCYEWKTEEQTALAMYIKSKNGTWISEDVFNIYSSDLNDSLSFHYFDTLLVTMSNSLYSYKIRKRFSKEARKRNIYKPVIFHLAWYWPTRKPSILYEKNAWFINFPKSKKCKKIPPNGTALIWDNKYDLPESPQIPKKFLIKYFPP